MTKTSLLSLTPDLKKQTNAGNTKYLEMYQQSVTNPEEFWKKHGKRIEWFQPFTNIKKVSFEENNLTIKWFYDGTTNASYNCLDRHLEKRAEQVAIIWEPDNEGKSRRITYRELHEQVSRFGNVLKNQGIGQGDVVVIYMPMVIEATVAMLACSRIGAVHTVVFAGFSAEALAGRIINCNAKIIITADEGIRNGKKIPIKANVDEALTHLETKSIKRVIVLRHTNASISWNTTRDACWHKLTSNASTHCKPEELNAEDPLFILYTSGSTAQPKGIVHTTGGYLVYASMTHQYVFDYKDAEVFWCNADIGWITGHSYVVYGPLLNGATVIMHEGVPNYPETNRMCKIIDKHNVNILYTAPTVLRSLMAEDKKAIRNTHRESLRILGSVGEPINPKTWRWYHNTIGNGQSQVIDTWWQTETGGIMIAPLPGGITLKPGSANRPFFGIKPALVDDLGRIIDGVADGNLVITDSWPGQARTIYGDHKRYIKTYFSKFKGLYFTSDGARRDVDGDYWITGRIDDVLNVSGHRMGTAEIESAMIAHPHVAEAAAVGFPHKIKGQGIYIYVTLNSNTSYSNKLKDELKIWIKKEIDSFATPDVIQWAPALPKTRSGKIMRRILRNIAIGEFRNLGDTSTLADPDILSHIIKNSIQTDTA